LPIVKAEGLFTLLLALPGRDLPIPSAESIACDDDEDEEGYAPEIVPDAADFSPSAEVEDASLPPAPVDLDSCTHHWITPEPDPPPLEAPLPPPTALPAPAPAPEPEEPSDEAKAAAGTAAPVLR